MGKICPPLFGNDKETLEKELAKVNEKIADLVVTKITIEHALNEIAK